MKGMQIRTRREHFSPFRWLKAVGKAPPGLTVMPQEEGRVRKETNVALNALILCRVSWFTLSIHCLGNWVFYRNVMEKSSWANYTIQRDFTGDVWA